MTRDSRGPKDHINIRISRSGSQAQYKGIPEIMVGRILMFMWSFGALDSCVCLSPCHCTLRFFKILLKAD